MINRFALLHRPLFIILALSIAVTLLITAMLGQAKPVAHFDWVDVLGEGGMTLVTLLWLVATLFSRLKGRVTTLLFFGLLAMHVSMLLDLLDEFWVYPSNAWITTFESIPATFGMLIMSVALYQWHLEQVTINEQLQQRERFYRDHSLMDFVTGLNSGAYMKQQLNREVLLSERSEQAFSVLMLDLKQFNHHTQTLGLAASDKVLRQVGQSIEFNCRQQDLTCRFASDRFIVLLPNTQPEAAKVILSHLTTSISSMPFNPYLSGTINAYGAVVTWSKGMSSEQLIAMLCQQITAQKQSVSAVA